MSWPGAANVAADLPAIAARDPEGLAVRVARRRGGALAFEELRWAELDRRSDAIAAGLLDRGLEPGDRACLFVRPGLDLVAVVFALFKAGVVPVLLDPGMGRERLLASIARMRPRAFVGIPLAHAARKLFPAAFESVELPVTVGPRWFWRGPTLAEVEARHDGRPVLSGGDPERTAAILFTSGSTGPPKGVVYSHANFLAQIRALRALYDFRPGEVDLACFPLFALFCPALGTTAVFPELDPVRPARCDPAAIVAALERSEATTTFGSPAIWRRVVPWCLARGRTLPRLKRVLVAGAPVPPGLIEAFRRVLPEDGESHTPYGATESLPVSTIAGREVLAETRALTERGAGTCVGRPAPEVELRLIAVDDAVIARMRDARPVAPGELGEVCVRGPGVTRAYAEEPGHTARAKLADEVGFWHRMGDLGRLDEQGRLWFCGRKAHRLETAGGLVASGPTEGVFDADPRVRRSALVGLGARGAERAALVVEARPGHRPRGRRAADALAQALVADARRRAAAPAPPGPAFPERVLFHRAFPVDGRHNAKIDRERLKTWAEERLR